MHPLPSLSCFLFAIPTTDFLDPLMLSNGHYKSCILFYFVLSPCISFPPNFHLSILKPINLSLGYIKSTDDPIKPILFPRRSSQ